LINTSAWIEFLRRAGDPKLKAQVGDILASGRAAYTCPFRLERYAGARKAERRTRDEALSFARRVEVTPEHWDAAAGYVSRLRAKSITVPASDLLVATVVAEMGAALVAHDEHFGMIRANVLPELKLV